MFLNILDLCCLTSIIGIWPRFFAPYRLKISTHKWLLSKKYAHLHKLRIVHISDLHFYNKLSASFLQRISKKINLLSPDIILFSGDFICRAILPKNADLLKNFLNSLTAPLGCFCSLGNHDYESYVSKNIDGIVAIKPANQSLLPSLWDKFKILFRAPNKKVFFSPYINKLKKNAQLAALLKQTSFKLLQNETIVLPCGLNITGLGDLFAKDYLPAQAFSAFKHEFPGIVMSHNPDTIPDLIHYPGNWIFSGHTHGGQIYLSFPPFLKRFTERLTGLSNPKFIRGTFRLSLNKIAHINAGLGHVLPIRFNSCPEISFFEFYYSHSS
ncbi:UDP-2,3-diacylglucosamine diphosphatase LpxG [Candidatus Clavichlamydia salmonicola]|uniref:UDP-2,3-diacylglucosamine diphosphatase LpxG n=1 Tax=Candidatus Clavichlamydia salmonicola TaxID=469812 RepID=UPI001890FE55|nr:UDP-2,3-diacylglucosamine diphosphatase LpxG [Candidatus Clavichlamydia salmonicola]